MRTALRAVDVFDGHRRIGPHNIVVEDGVVETLEPARSARGGVVLPGVIDAHVHLSFSTPDAIAKGGVTGVLDLGEPLDAAFGARPPLRYAASGPLLTAPGGYPTRSWGAGGFGLEIADEAAARDAVATLADAGAAMIKTAVVPGELDAGRLRAVVEAAAARGLRVAAHALDAAAVRTSIEAGVAVLAHTPLEPLDDDVLASAGQTGLTVISTVRAFGDRPETRANLRALAAAGCPVVYGTDLGNDGIAPGIDAAEVAALAETLGSLDEALAAATSAAASLAGLPGGRIEAGAPADLILADRFTPEAIAHPRGVWIAGERIV